MAEAKKGKKLVTRRDFLVGSGAVIAAGALGAYAPKALGSANPVTTTAPGAVNAAKPWLPEKWDYEADIVIAGTGYAGQAAAIVGHDKGADVLVLEKASEEMAGGNSCCSVGGSSIFINTDYAYTEFRAAAPDVPEELVVAMAEAMDGAVAFCKSLGIEIGANITTIKNTLRITNAATGGTNGYHLWLAFQACVEQRGINIMYNTPVKKLVQDPVTKEILGVVAYEGASGFYGEGGKKVYIKAKKGVILACGSYEGNLKMWSFFNYPGMEVWAGGTPYNTGDGLLMACEVGAPLWHMVLKEWENPVSAAASRVFGMAIECSFATGQTWVNRAGERFMSETATITHQREEVPTVTWKSGMDAIPNRWMGPGGYPNMPFFLICDDTYRKSRGFVAAPRPGSDTKFAHVKQVYSWSSDNMTEVAKGWVIQANTIAELAAKLGIDAEGLQHTVDLVNEVNRTKKDPQFGNTRLVAIKTPPFYGMELGMSLINTMGGPQHNGKGQTLNTEGKPIPRLYTVGELGSFFSKFYSGGCNIPEAYMFGKIAAEHAAALAPWE